MECVADKENNNNDNKDDKKECPEGTEWVEDLTRLRAAALCASLAGTTRTPVPGLAASAPVAQQLRLLALLSAWRTLAWTPPRKQKSVKKEKFAFLTARARSACPSVSPASTLALVPFLPQLPQGIRDEMAPVLPPASRTLAPAARRTRRRTAPRAPSMSRKTSMALAAAPSAAPARTAPPACIPARAAKVARTPRRVVPLSALTILRSALQALS